MATETPLKQLIETGIKALKLREELLFTQTVQVLMANNAELFVKHTDLYKAIIEELRGLPLGSMLKRLQTIASSGYVYQPWAKTTMERVSKNRIKLPVEIVAQLKKLVGE